MTICHATLKITLTCLANTLTFVMNSKQLLSSVRATKLVYTMKSTLQQKKKIFWNGKCYTNWFIRRTGTNLRTFLIKRLKMFMKIDLKLIIDSFWLNLLLYSFFSLTLLQSTVLGYITLLKVATLFNRFNFIFDCIKVIQEFSGLLFLSFFVLSFKIDLLFKPLLMLF